MILVFVYLGSKVPKYVTANMKQIASRFPDQELVFIGDNSGTCRKYERLGFKTWLSPNPESSWEIDRFSFSHDPDFRDGFWFKTLARFFALNEFLKTIPDTACLLIESDVWVSPTFPMNQFENAEFEIAYPLTTVSQGVASTFFVKSQLQMQHFLDFSIDEVRRDPSSSDVTILAEYRKHFPDLVVILPSGPINISAYNSGFQEIDSALMSDQRFFRNQVFDGSTWGQFLTGEDPRNSWGFTMIYHIQPHHAVNPSLFNFKLIDNNIIANYQGVDYVIHSLHVHSKDIRVFSDENFVMFRINAYRGRQISQIVWKSFIRFIPSRVKYETLKFVRTISRDSDK
jgi:hypothetical protein